MDFLFPKVSSLIFFFMRQFWLLIEKKLSLMNMKAVYTCKTKNKQENLK